VSASDVVLPRAVVAGHGSFPEGLVSAVTQITGRGGALIPLSNLGLGREEIEERLRDLLARHHINVIFTDLPGGSATLAARRIMRDIPTLTLVTGANLAALVDFVFRDGTLDSADAASQAAEKGKAALTIVTGS
jgi:N-acetylgalactosamine PTS system EIIA component